jgi:hypothetical protein
MSDSIQAADGNETRTITMQGKSRTILQFNVRHWGRRPWRRKEDKSPCLLILSVFGRECCRSTATYEKVTQQSWWKRPPRPQKKDVRCDNKVHDRSEEDQYYDCWLPVPSDYHPKTLRSIQKNTKSTTTTTISNFRIECHLFRNAKSFECKKEHKKPLQKKCRLQRQKREYPIFKLCV